MSGDRSGLTLTLTSMSCRAGCGVRASVFGFCEAHVGDFLKREFLRVVGEGFADLLQPECFDSMEQWREYVVAYDMAQRQTSSPSRRRKVDPCRDCTAQHRDAMIGERRCAHPETVFVVADRSREVIGINADRQENWEKAMMGMMGHVVSMPDPDVVNATVERLNAAQAAKKRGRPRKIESSDE